MSENVWREPIWNELPHKIKKEEAEPEKKPLRNTKRARIAALIKSRAAEKKRTKYDISSSDPNSFTPLSSVPDELITLPGTNSVYEYIRILFDAFNSVDLVELDRFLNIYCTEDIKIVHLYDGDADPTGNELRTEFNGRRAILGMWKCWFDACPDVIFAYHCETACKSAYTNETMTITSYTSEFTKKFNFIFPEEEETHQQNTAALNTAIGNSDIDINSNNINNGNNSDDGDKLLNKNPPEQHIKVEKIDKNEESDVPTVMPHHALESFDISKVFIETEEALLNEKILPSSLPAVSMEQQEEDFNVLMDALLEINENDIIRACDGYNADNIINATDNNNSSMVINNNDDNDNSIYSISNNSTSNNIMPANAGAAGLSNIQINNIDNGNRNSNSDINSNNINNSNNCINSKSNIVTPTFAMLQQNKLASSAITNTTITATITSTAATTADQTNNQQATSQKYIKPAYKNSGNNTVISTTTNGYSYGRDKSVEHPLKLDTCYRYCGQMSMQLNKEGLVYNISALFKLVSVVNCVPTATNNSDY